VAVRRTRLVLVALTGLTLAPWAFAPPSIAAPPYSDYQDCVADHFYSVAQCRREFLGGGGGLSTLAIVGIAVGGLLLAAGTGWLVIRWWRARQSRRPAPQMEGRRDPRPSEASPGQVPTEWRPGWYPNPDNPREQRYWDGRVWTDQTMALSVFDRLGGFGLKPSPADPQIAPNPLALAVAGLGALLMVVGVFLPRVESRQFLTVADNTLIQSGDGWIFIGLAIAIAGASYAALRRQRRAFAVLVLGLAAVALAIYEGTGDRLELRSLNPGARSVLNLPNAEQGSPGIGIYMVGAGGALAALAGLTLAGLSLGPGGDVPTRRTKTCPDCAETILADAQVCKHCGYRFDQALAERVPPSAPP
jgi:hypothetical protein